MTRLLAAAVLGAFGVALLFAAWAYAWQNETVPVAAVGTAVPLAAWWMVFGRRRR